VKLPEKSSVAKLVGPVVLQTIGASLRHEQLLQDAEGVRTSVGLSILKKLELFYLFMKMYSLAYYIFMVLRGISYRITLKVTMFLKWDRNNICHSAFSRHVITTDVE
jgi:hypothetical protein